MLPTTQLAAGISENPAAYRDDQADFFVHRNKFSRADPTIQGVLPAQQCLETVDQALVGNDDWLVGQPKFTSTLRQAQFRFQLQAA